MAIEGWSAWDAFYMTVITVSTVGYREVHELSRAGEVFTSALLICGVGTAFYALTLVAAGIIESRLHPRIQEKRRARMIDKLTDHFILCGAGRIGLIIAEEFRRQSVPFVVIDHDPVRGSGGPPAGRSSASRRTPAARRCCARLRIDAARGLIAALGHRRRERLHDSHRARPSPGPVRRSPVPIRTTPVGRLLKAGANRVVSPYQIGAVRLAQTALRPAVVDFVELATSSENLELAMEQVQHRRRVGAGGPDDSRSQRAPAVRRHRRRHPARGRAHGLQPAARRRHARPATNSWCWAARGSLRDLEVAAQMTAAARQASRSHPRRRRGRRADQGRAARPRGGLHRGAAEAARPRASSWSATIRRRRSTSATS